MAAHISKSQNRLKSYQNDKQEPSGMCADEFRWPSHDRMHGRERDWNLSFIAAAHSFSAEIAARNEYLSRTDVIENELQGLKDRIEGLERDAADLKKSYNELKERPPIVVPITSLDPEPFDLCQEIAAVVQPDGDSFVATFFDANINASGNTEVDAVANLKDMLIAMFVSLEKESKLARGPACQLAILRKILRKKG